MYYWLVPESPRWLLSVNRVESARRVIEKIARFNRNYEISKQSFLDRFFKGLKNFMQSTFVNQDTIY